MKILKYISIIVLVTIIGIVGYIYYLTFTPHGRLNWGQAVFLKLAATDDVAERLKKMTILERSHFIDAMPINLEGVSVDTIKITNDIILIDTVLQFDNIADWRRNNVDLTIEMLHDTIKSVKSYVKFGISPFGIWRNKKEDPQGSATNGYTNYDGLYADVLKWFKNGWLDYMAPQIYWYIGYPSADYKTLVEWWKDNHYGRHIYVGEGLYRVNSEVPAWQNPSEMPEHLRLTRRYPTINGNIYFTSKTFKDKSNSFLDSMKTDFYKFPALIPTMKWIDSIPPKPVTLVMNKSFRKYHFSWLPDPSDTMTEDEMTKPKYYVVYRFKGSKTGSFDDPQNIYAITKENELVVERRFFAFFKTKFTFSVTAVDRLHNESAPSYAYKVKIKE